MILHLHLGSTLKTVRLVPFPHSLSPPFWRWLNYISIIRKLSRLFEYFVSQLFTKKRDLATY